MQFYKYLSMGWFFYIMLANAVWSIADVSMSMIMNRMHSSSIIVTWFLSVVQIVALLLLYAFLPVEITWMKAFAISGFFGYVGSLCFFKLLQRVDVSISSTAWVILSLGIAIGGMVLFGETWTPLQAIGAILSLSGATVLALWHKRVERLETFFYLFAAGLLYVPPFLISKSALLQGVSPVTAFFWPLLFFNVFAIILPVTTASYRSKIRELLQSLHWWFSGLIALWVVSCICGWFLVTKAYELGNASLVSIAENGQPFFLMFIAWIATLLVPKYAPREIITAQTTGVKTASFVIVFVGLALLAI